MDLALVGLGRMGGGIARRLLRAGARVVVTNRSSEPVNQLAREGAAPAPRRSDVISLLAPPRIVWLMLPSGAATEDAVLEFRELLSPGDILVDGSNSYYRDTQRHASLLEQKGILQVDVGVSGGIWGLDNGYCLMAGGEAGAVSRLESVLRTLAPTPDSGWAHVGPAGAGHYAKMVHNGIEYGIMQSYAEGFALLHRAEELVVDPAELARVWNQGSVIRSWLLELCGSVLVRDPSLRSIQPYVDDSGEGRWTVADAIERDLAAPVLTLSLLARLASRDQEDFGARLLATLRHEFGGHHLPVAD